MSIYQDIKSSFRNGDVLMQIIGINIAIYIVILISWLLTLLFKLPDPIDFILVNYLMLPADVGELIYKPWTIITYMFMHKTVFHILFNLLVLYWFGRLFIEYLGEKKFLPTYLMGGVFGGLFYVFCYNVFPYFDDKILLSRALGASAAIMTIVFAAATLLPNFSIVLAIFGPVKLKYIAAIYLVLDLVSIGGSNAGGHLAHIGGALFGFLYIKSLQNGYDLSRMFANLIDWISKVLKPKQKIKVAYRNQNYTQQSNKISQEEIDRILDKISSGGYESLSAKEKEQLFKAGKE